MTNYDAASTHIAIVGGGNMGQAILAGWLAAQTGPAALWGPDNFTVVDPGDEKRASIAEQYGVACVADAQKLPKSDIVLLSVKPQVIFDVLASMSSIDWLNDALCISIAAGISLHRLEQALPNGCAVIRTMPNMPLQVGQGATALCAGSKTTEEQLLLARDLFASIGSAHIVDETDIDATTAISGSGPAYVAAMVEALTSAGEEAGLDAQLAEALARDTVAGTGAMMQQQHISARALREAVSSPNGTTVAALAAMEEGGFSEALRAGVRAAIARSIELGAEHD